MRGGQNKKEHPSFLLMKQTRRQKHLLYADAALAVSDPRYADMDLDAKVTYTFLLNRFRLSRRGRDGSTTRARSL